MPQTKYFTSPKVDPILLIVEKVLKNDKGEVITEDGRVFDVKITGNNGYDQTYPVSAGQRKVMTNLRREDTYTVAETNVSGPSNVEDYETTINIYGEDTNTFVINQGDPDTTVRVTNQEKSLGKLTVKKCSIICRNPPRTLRPGPSGTPDAPRLSLCTDKTGLYHGRVLLNRRWHQGI